MDNFLQNRKRWSLSCYRDLLLANQIAGKPVRISCHNNGMLLLTSCEVHTGKYLDGSFEVRTERSEVRTKS